MSEFFETIFGDQEGFICLERFQNGQPNGRKFVAWPSEKASLKSFQRNAKSGDLYFRPVLFRERSVSQEYVTGSLVTWADVDAAAPGDLGAGLAVASGTPGHVHAYWPAERLLAPDEVVKWNYYNAIRYGADMGGYDLLQLLRVPGTLNHKTDPPQPVTLIHFDPTPVPMPEGIDDIKVPKYRKPDILPSLGTILERSTLSETTATLLSSPVPDDRSGAMFRLACLLCEEGLSADESYVVLNEVDGRWGKFTGRHDRELRLSQLIARAYEKTLVLIDDVTQEKQPPVGPKVPEKRTLEAVGWAQLAVGLPPVEYLIEGILRENGMIVLAGDTGVGKTQAAIQIAAKLVLGAKSWAGFPIKIRVPQKVLYLSLEMDQHGLDEFTNRMQAALDTNSLRELDERMLFYASYDYFKLDVEGKNSARQLVEEYVVANGITGIVIDTLQAVTSESLQDEKSVRNMFGWANSMRHKHGIWFIVLAHPRKATAGTKRKDRELTTDELYGSRLIGDQVDGIFALVLADKTQGILQLQNLKSRYTAGQATINLRRSENLWLEPTKQTPNEDSDVAGDFTLEDDLDAFNLEDDL